jgi:hypothetical protein
MSLGPKIKISREDVLQIAEELSAVGMKPAAQAASEIAAGKPSEVDPMGFCPYPDDAANKTNRAAWLAGEQRRQRGWGKPI